MHHRYAPVPQQNGELPTRLITCFVNKAGNRLGTHNSASMRDQVARHISFVDVVADESARDVNLPNVHHTLANILI
jgi:hypothetical protein